MATIPDQERALDPFSSNRYSSTINRFTRAISGGTDCILHEEVSFPITRINDTTIQIGAGLCVKDDVLIHITQDDYQIDLSDWDYYVDENTGGSALDSTGYYYVVLNYTYNRSLPAPKAYYKMIKDATNLYIPSISSYIFLGAIHVVPGGEGYILNSPTCVYDYDPVDPLIERPKPSSSAFYIDGGVLS